MVAHARSILKEQALAEDAVQQAMLRIFEIATLRVDMVRDVRAWMARLTRREALMLLRSRGREARRAAAHARATTQPVGQTRDTRILDTMVASLPRRLQEVLVLRHRGALTFDQIATVLSVNRSTVASRYREALARLRASGLAATPTESLSTAESSR